MSERGREKLGRRGGREGRLEIGEGRVKPRVFASWESDARERWGRWESCGRICIVDGERERWRQEASGRVLRGDGRGN